MKSFSFPLDRVRQYRETQARLEEAKLERLYAERRAYETRRERLIRQRTENETLLLSQSVDALQLAALDRFGRYVGAQNQIVAREVAQCDQKIEAQKNRVTEARRQYRLLDKLREKRLSAWQNDCDRELEAQAAESYLAQWPARSLLD